MNYFIKSTVHCLFICMFSLSPCYAQIIFNTPNDAVQFAIQNSQTLKLDAINAQLALQNAKYAITDFLPSLSFSFSESDTIEQHAADVRSKSLDVSLTQFLYDGGKRTLSYRMAKSESLLAYKSYLSNLQSFTANIFSLYYDCICAHKAVSIQEQVAACALEQLTIIKSEQALGLALQTDYLEYQIQVMQLQNELAQSQRTERTCLRKLKAALGLDIQFDITLGDVSFDSIEEPLYENHINTLYSFALKNNVSVQKQQYALLYGKKQLEQSHNYFLPDVNLVGSMSFTGTTYPLTQPSYQLKLSFSFSRNPFTPLSVSNGATFTDKRMSSMSNNAQTSVNPQIDFMVKQAKSKTAMLQTYQSFEQQQTELYEGVFSSVSSHDDCVSTLHVLEDTIHLEELKLTVSEREMAAGEIKRIDYLKVLIELAQQKVQLLQTHCKLSSSTRELEILIGIPIGGIRNVIMQ